MASAEFSEAILPTPLAESTHLLSWSHYERLMRVADAFFRIASVVGWARIEAGIIENKHQVSFPLEGLALCNFGIKVINGDGKAKISKRDLHLGTECLKSLQEIYCNRDYNLDVDGRLKRLQWEKDFLDIWKEYLEECLKNENRMIA